MVGIESEEAFGIARDFIENCRIAGKGRVGHLIRHQDELGVHFGFLAVVGPQWPKERMLNEVLLGLAMKFTGVEVATYHQPNQTLHPEVGAGNTFLVCVVSSSAELHTGFMRYVLGAEWIQRLIHTAFVTVSLGN